MNFVYAEQQHIIDAVAAAAAGSEWRFLVTPNAAHLGLISRNAPELLPVWQSAAFVLLDSKVVHSVAKLCGLRAPPVFAGSDLVKALFDQVIGPDTTVHVVCSDGPRIEAFARRIGLRHLTISIPPMGLRHDSEAMRAAAANIAHHRADFTFIAVGAPQQEILASLVADLGGARGVGLCIGAGLDFISGAQRRAPLWLRRFGLEWAYRFAHQPRRLARRYLIESPRGIGLVLRHAWRRPG